jgi:transposase
MRHMGRMCAADVPPDLAALRQLPRDQLVSPVHPARFINDFVDTLDVDALGFIERRRANWREPHPVRKLLKVCLLAWFERIPGQRALAKVCRWDVRFLYLSECDPPKRSSIGRFWRDNYTAFQAVFDELVRRARQAGLVGMDLHALDGTKIRAACSMHTALHREAEKKS